jgi:hypothetical protein
LSCQDFPGSILWGEAETVAARTPHRFSKDAASLIDNCAFRADRVIGSGLRAFHEKAIHFSLLKGRNS